MKVQSERQTLITDIDQGEVIRNGVGLAFLFVLFELTAATSLAPFAFTLMAAVCILGLLFRFDLFFLSTLTLAILQTPYPVFVDYNTGLGTNWYTMNMGPLSLIHVLAVSIMVIGFSKILKNGHTSDRKILKILLLLIFLFATSSSMGLFYHFSKSQMLIEMGEYMYLISFLAICSYLLKGNNLLEERLFRFFVVYIPIGVVLGQFIWQLPRFIGWRPYDIYGAVNVYAFSILVWHVFTSPNKGIRWICFFVLFVGILAIAPYIGSSILLAIVGVAGLATLRNISFGEGANTILFLFLLIACSSGILAYEILIRQSEFTLLKLYQISRVFTASDLSEIPQSTLIRIKELYNIILSISESAFSFLFGHGFGGFFTDEYLSFGTLRKSAFNDVQRATDKYYAPHNNPQYVLLKHGFLGLTFWGWAIWKSMMAALRSRRNQAVFGALLVPSLFVLYGWGVNNALLIGVLAALFLYNRSSR